MGVYILFDIGGTKTRVAVTTDLETFTVKKFDTPKQYEEGLLAIKAAVAELAPDMQYFGIAGGIRGELNAREDVLASDSVLHDWVGKTLSRDLDRAFGAPVILRNDAAMAALGEAVFGSGQGYERVSYHTVSTGVGDALVVKENVERTHDDLADGPHSLEDSISGTALAKKRGVKPYKIPQTDPVWDELASQLAEGLLRVILEWNPQVIVLGGSMIIGDPRIRLEDITRHTKEILGQQQRMPKIVDATLTDEAGLYGAMALIAQKQGGRPKVKRIWTKGPFRWIATLAKKWLKI